jgi:predicted CXXCH cytochrome family protein
MKRLLWLALALAGSAQAVPGRVAGTKHDLSASGRGGRRAVSEGDPCVFCHTSHRAARGLNNRPDRERAFKPYESSTMSNRGGDPTGASRICLSCHDGTIALGKTLTRDIKMAGGDFLARGQKGHIGTDLRGSHPVSVLPSGGGSGHGPREGDRVRLDAAGEVQCTSCHDPHSEMGGDPVNGKFLVKPLARAELCATCHASQAASGGSTHASSALPIRDAEGRPTTLAEQGCVACHDLHDADPRGRLLKPGRTDDSHCLRCHSSAAEGGDIARQLAKSSSHAAVERGGHDEGEDPQGTHGRTLPEASSGARRHVACADCHEPHTSTRTAASAPLARGAVGRAWGVSLEGQRVEPARYEYEICLKCHGDSANKPRGGGETGIRRAQPDDNLRLAFAPSAISSHPVAAPGRNTNVPSLKAPWTASSVTYCTDCHDADDSAASGGAGARGPHGSSFPFLLAADYRTADYTPESASAYALCYRCHDRNRLLSAATTFKRASGPEPSLHYLHVVTQSAPCSACHDAHGVAREAGADENNAHLISFDLNIARKATAPAPRYTTAGPGHGSCNLTCHDKPPHADLTHRY